MTALTNLSEAVNNGDAKRIATTLIFAGFLLAFALPARADLPVVTFSTSGTIAEGADELNIFFQPGQGFSLAGQRFTMSISVDAGTLPTLTASHEITHLSNDSVGAAATATGALTVNSRTYTWSINAAYATVFMARPGEGLGSFPHSAFMGAQGFNMANGYFTYASSQIVSEITPFMSSVDIARNVVFNSGLPGVDTDSYFSTTYYTGETWPGGPVIASTWFNTQNPLSSATWTVSPVPEPGTYAMLLAGIVTIRLLRLRKK